MQANSLQEYLESVHRDYAGLDGGEVASYIPELTKADPAWFGIALITVDGHVYQEGDSRQSFTIQSISKAISYGIALEDKGVEAVLKKVGVEPSGEAFNSISLEPDTGRPLNPMINAGAIATVSLIAGDTPAAKMQRMLKTYKDYLGHPVVVDQEVYLSEKSTGHRNRAIAYLLHNSNIIEKDTDEVLDAYFQQCSILVTCRDLALMGATLANDGVNPITGVRALQSCYVPKVLSVMSSCGMYDYSGAWIYEVGMPAKSGVGGGIVAVLPGQFGLAVFSPPLDERGNSVRGLAVCKRISSDFGLHMLHTNRTSAPTVFHSIYDATMVQSKRTRNVEQTRLLAELGHMVCVLELKGDLVFSSAEIVIGESMRLSEKADKLIIDFTRVGTINGGALNLLIDLVRSQYDHGKTVLFTGIANQYVVKKSARGILKNLEELPLLRFDDVDHALEWCEECLLAGQGGVGEGEAPLATQAFCAGFSEPELSALAAMLERRQYAAGDYLCREGEPADCLYFLLQGQVSVSVPLGQRRSGRISTISAGSAFGEMAMLDQGKRSADIIADTDVTCSILDYTRLDHSAMQDDTVAQVRLKLVTNIARGLTKKLRQATLEIKSLRN